MTNMTLNVRQVNSGVVFEVSGRLMYESDSLFFRQKLNDELEQGKRWIVLDLSRVVGLSSTGLGILISAHRTISEHGGTLKLAHLSDKVRSALQITRLNTIFEIFDSVAEAVGKAKDNSLNH